MCCLAEQEASKKAQNTKAARRARKRDEALRTAGILTVVTCNGLSATVPATFNRNARSLCEASLGHKDEPLLVSLGVSYIQFQFNTIEAREGVQFERTVNGKTVSVVVTYVTASCRTAMTDMVSSEQRRPRKQRRSQPKRPWTEKEHEELRRAVAPYAHLTRIPWAHKVLPAFNKGKDEKDKRTVGMVSDHCLSVQPHEHRQQADDASAVAEPLVHVEGGKLKTLHV